MSQQRSECRISLGLSLVAVTIRGQEAMQSGQYRPLSIALYAAALQHNLKCRGVGIVLQHAAVQVGIYLIIEARGELKSPAIELKVDERRVPLFINRGYEGMVASPSVVDGALDNADGVLGPNVR